LDQDLSRLLWRTSHDHWQPLILFTSSPYAGKRHVQSHAMVEVDHWDTQESLSTSTSHRSAGARTADCHSRTRSTGRCSKPRSKLHTHSGLLATQQRSPRARATQESHWSNGDRVRHSLLYILGTVLLDQTLPAVVMLADWPTFGYRSGSFYHMLACSKVHGSQSSDFSKVSSFSHQILASSQFFSP